MNSLKLLRLSILYIALSGGVKLSAQTKPLVIKDYKNADISFVGANHQDVFAQLDFSEAKEDLEYRKLLNKIYTENRVSWDEVYQFLEEYPTNLNREKLKLMVLLYRLKFTGGVDDLADFEALDLRQLDEFDYCKVKVVKAHLLYRDGEIEGAKQELKDALDDDNYWSRRAMLFLAEIDLKQGLLDKTREVLDFLSQEIKDNKEGLLERLVLLQSLLRFKTQSLSEAIHFAQKHSQIYPSLNDDGDFMGVLGQAYYHLNDLNNTEYYLERKLDKFGWLSDEEALVLASSYYKRAKYALIEDILLKPSEGASELAGKSAYILANAYLLQNKRELAQQYYQRVKDNEAVESSLKEGALYQLILLNKGEDLDVFGKSLSYIEEFLKSYPHSPRQAEVKSLLNDYILKSKDYEKSLQLINELERKGLNLNNLKQEVLYRLVMTTDQQDPLYLSYLNEAIRLGQSTEHYRSLLLYRGEYEMNKGDYQKAEIDLRHTMCLPFKKTKEEPSDMVQYLYAYVLYNQDMYEASYKVFEKFVAESRDDDYYADALCRMGDCLSNKSGKSKERLDLYKKAYQMSERSAEQSLYRIAQIYDQNALYQEEIQVVDRFLERYESSPYAPEMMYAKGRSYLVGLKDSKGAEAVYQDLVKKYPNSAYASLSLLELAMSQSNRGEDDKAIETYQYLIKNYPNSKELELALTDLKAIYQDQNRMDVYREYVSSLPNKVRGNESLSELRLSFLSLQSRHKRGEDIYDELKRFVQTHKETTEGVEAQLLLTQILEEKNEAKDKVLDAYNSLQLDRLSQEELLFVNNKRLALYQNLGDKAGALKVSEELYQASKGNTDQALAVGLSLIDLALEQEETELAQRVIDELLTNQNNSEDVKSKLLLKKGSLLQQQNKPKEAIAIYTEMQKLSDSSERAEALVRKALLLVKEREVLQAKELLEDFIKAGSSQTYWLARAFITLSDVHYIIGEDRKSEQYLQSLKANYPGDEQDIKNMIEERLNRKKYEKEAVKNSKN